MARSKTEAAKSKVESAVALGGLGAGLGGPVGGAIGALTGLIIGDRNTVFPLDMVAIPAYQAYMLDDHNPQFVIYIRAGETLVPTGGNVQDMQEAMLAAGSESPVASARVVDPIKRKQLTSYQKKYKREFAKVAPKYKKKDGTWKKDGFKAAVRAAHKRCR